MRDQCKVPAYQSVHTSTYKYQVVSCCITSIILASEDTTENSSVEGMAVDITSRFHQLGAMPELGAFVSKSCSHLKITDTKPVVPWRKPTANENKSISQQSFGDDLNFTVDVNLVDSKAAFEVLVGGLDTQVNFLGLWLNMNNSDPCNHPHPMGDLNVAPLDKKREKVTETKEETSTAEESEMPKAKKATIDKQPDPRI